MRGFVARSREHHIVPVITLCYTRNDFTPVEYEYTRRMNLAINAWDVPSVNFLGAVDDGTGKWAKGFWHDSLHPNAAGHDELRADVRADAVRRDRTGQAGAGAIDRDRLRAHRRRRDGDQLHARTPRCIRLRSASPCGRTRDGERRDASAASTLTAAMAMKTEERAGGRGALEFETTTLTRGGAVPGDDRRAARRLDVHGRRTAAPVRVGR